MCIMESLLSYLGGGWLGMESADSDELVAVSVLDILLGVCGLVAFNFCVFVALYSDWTEFHACLFVYIWEVWSVLAADWLRGRRCQIPQSLVHVRDFPYLVRLFSSGCRMWQFFFLVIK